MKFEIIGLIIDAATIVALLLLLHKLRKGWS
jgi:hypothetical protein